MKKEQQLQIRNRAWKFAWEEYKAKYTMSELAEVFNTSLPTFFRIVKDKKNEQGSKKIH